MIEKGKAIVTTNSSDSEDPWKLVSYSDMIPQDTIDVFNFLVDEMESRLPGYDDNMSDTTSPLIEEAALGAANLRRGFLHHFARKANRPSFRYIAPDTSFSEPGQMVAPRIGKIVGSPMTTRFRDSHESSLGA
jgi:hypothetical protein